MPAESNPDGISTASDPIVYIPVFNFGFLIDPFNVDLLKRVSSSCNLPFKREQAESFPRLSAFTNEKVQIGLVVDYHIFIIPSIKSF